MPVILRDCFIGNFPITQRFGANPAVYKPYGLAGHEGVDFGCPRGTPVVAATDGIVLHAGQEAAWSAYGNFVEIWDATQRCATLYGHFLDVAVKVGQKVWCGELLGHSDNTGHSTGDHLHFGLCLTDAAGNRLNRGNGFGGWIDSLNKANVTWDIKNLTAPIAAPTPPVIIVPPPIEPPPPKVMPDPLQPQVDALTAQVAALQARLAQINTLSKV